MPRQLAFGLGYLFGAGRSGRCQHSRCAAKLVSSISPKLAQLWRQSGPRQWANESFEITESVQTKYCEMHGSSCDQPSGTVKIDQAYIDRNVPIVKEQLQKAGVRLAGLLDKALGE